MTMAENFTVTDHNYLNTGGHCMVSIFTVYDRSAKASRFVIANEEGFNWQTIDTVGHEPPADLTAEDVYLGTWDWSSLTTEPSFDQHQFTDDEWELFKYCQFEFYKEYCKTFKIKVELPYQELSTELYEKLEPRERDWLDAHGDLVLTDGYNVWMPESYVDEWSEQHKKKLEAVVNFKKWFDEQLYDNGDILSHGDMVIALGGRSVSIPVHADTYELMEVFLDKVIKEW